LEQTGAVRGGDAAALHARQPLPARTPSCLLPSPPSTPTPPNPPQKAAAFYVDDSLAEFDAGGVATSVQHNGKEMSYNNYLDADAAYVTCCDFKVRPAREAPPWGVPGGAHSPPCVRPPGLAGPLLRAPPAPPPPAPA
jgi:hypothetical protein